MAQLLLATSLCATLTPMRPPSAAIVSPAEAAASSIQILRAPPGDYSLCKELAELAVAAFYGKHRYWDGPFAYMQRGIIQTDCLDDVAARLRFYEEARDRVLEHVGAVFIAEDSTTGEVIGFADVGLTLYNTRTRSFRLPKRPEGDTYPVGGTVARPSFLWPRVYLSNLAVDAAHRQRGAGRLLVTACEDEVAKWSLPRGETPEGLPACERSDDVWLEVSLDNDVALSFYRALGYETVAETKGREVVRRRFSYESATVSRAIMKKSLLPSTGL